MKKQNLNGTIIRFDYSKQDNFLQISKSIILNKNLTDSALRLLQLIIDTPPSVKISLTYYQKKLSWSKNKLASATKNLKENGYLMITKSKYDNTYFFNVSEFGNLKQNVEETVQETVQEEIPPAPEVKLEIEVEEPPMEKINDIQINNMCLRYSDKINKNRYSEFVSKVKQRVEQNPEITESELKNKILSISLNFKKKPNEDAESNVADAYENNNQIKLEENNQRNLEETNGWNF